MRTVQVIYHQEPEGWWAESPDVEGFGASGETLEELRDLVREGLPFYYRGVGCRRALPDGGGLGPGHRIRALAFTCRDWRERPH